MINTFIFFNLVTILTFTKRWWVKFLISIECLALFYCLLKTASKASIITLLIGFFLLPVIVPEFRNKLLRIILSAMILLAIFLTLAGKIIIKRFEVMATGQVDFLQDRIDWWKEGFARLGDTHGLGLGAGGFAVHIDPIPAAHSLYFSILFEYGYLGLIIFLLLWGILFFQLFSTIPKVPQFQYRLALYSIALSIILIFIHGAVELEYTYYFLWFLFAFMQSIINVGLQQTENISVNKKL